MSYLDNYFDETYHKQNDEAIRLANSNYTYQKMLERNIKNAREQREYKRNLKRKKQEQIKRAITTIALITTLTIGTATITTNVKANHETKDNTPSPSIFATIEANSHIDRQIEKYKEQMISRAGKDNSIETFISYYNNEEQVKYTEKNIENLANKIVQASNISESEARCVIIAAYNIINAPYRDDVLNKAFEKADAIQKESEQEIYNYDIPKSTAMFLRSLGYNDWEEYHNNERENIKETRALEESIGGKNR